MDLHLKQINNNQKIDLVLIHGWGIHSIVFNAVAEKLSSVANIYLLDLPGYGFNHEASYTFNEYSQLLEDLHKVIPQNCILLGWSLGGLIALDYAIHYSQDLKGLITVCSSPRFTELLDDDNEHEQIWSGVTPRTLKAFTRLLKPNNKDQVCDQFLALQAMGSPSIRHDIRALRKALANEVKPTYEALIMGLHILDKVDVREEAIKLNTPMLHCFGKFDRLVSSEELIKYWQNNSNSIIKLFEKTSHNPFLSEFELFCTTMINFINRCVTHKS